MSDKYKTKDANHPLKNQKLELTRNFEPDYPWGVFKGEDGKDYTLPFENVKKVEDDEQG